VFHIEMRMRGHVARVFNLSADDLDRRFLGALVSGRTVEFEDVAWKASDTRVRVFEAPELRFDQLGAGRGWVNVERIGSEVTQRVLAAAGDHSEQQAAHASLKERLIGRLSAGPVPLTDVVTIAADMNPSQRASAQLAASEDAVWELLHRDSAVLLLDGAAVPKEQWEQLVLSAASWLGRGEPVELAQT
jgi:hypothetical protein